MLGLVMTSFEELFPEVARRERFLLRVEGDGPGIPAGTYFAHEAYCVDPSCDCRRVMLTVFSEAGAVMATIGLPLDWDEEEPILDPLNRQSRHAEDFLRAVEEVLEDCPELDDRLEAHYALVKRAAADPTHRIQALISSLRSPPAREFARNRRRIGRNERCPCGSGQKYKRCCLGAASRSPA